MKFEEVTIEERETMGKILVEMDLVEVSIEPDTKEQMARITHNGLVAMNMLVVLALKRIPEEIEELEWLKKRV